MANPFLKQFVHADLVVKTRARNLFWILLTFSVGFIALAFLTARLGDVLLPIALSLVTVVLLRALYDLWKGRYRTAATITFIALVLGALAGSLGNRTGYLEADMYQTIALFLLALTVTGAFGYSGWMGLIIAIAGFASLIYMQATPFASLELVQTIAYLNSRANPVALHVLFLLSGAIGTYNLYQYGWILRQMRAAQDTISAHADALEQTVADRTSDIRNLMDNTGQGFLTFGSDFLVEPLYSKGCRSMFNRPIEGLRVDELLFPRGSDPADEFVQGLTLYFKGLSKGSVIFDLLEKSTYIDGKFLSIEYREASQGKILCIITDITVVRQLADRNKAEAERQTIILRALNHKHFFSGFIEEANGLFDALHLYETTKPLKSEVEDLLRHMHTFKGNAGFFGFQVTQEMAHDFEYALSDSLVLGGEIPYRDFSLDLKKAYYQELKVITDIMGKDWLEEAGGIVIPRSFYDRIAKYVRTKFPGEKKLVHYLEHYRKIALKELFSRFPFIAAATAEKLGKRINSMVVTGGDLRVVPERFEGLVESCIHIVNNMVDHGIEYTYEREAQQKDPAGNLEIRLDRGPDSLIMLFIDDGRGISVAEIERISREKGLIGPEEKPSPQEILQYLFHDGFTTRKEVSEVSGRGVGLAAVREEVQKLGGTIEVHTKIGQGSEFEIYLPLKTLASRQKLENEVGIERRKM